VNSWEGEKLDLEEKEWTFVQRFQSVNATHFSANHLKLAFQEKKRKKKPPCQIYNYKIFVRLSKLKNKNQSDDWGFNFVHFL